MKIAVDVAAVTAGDIDFSEFERLGEVEYFNCLPRSELAALFSQCDAVVVNKVDIDEDLLSVCPKLRYIGVFATGYNCIDTAACRRRGIPVCNVPDYSTNSVSQHVFALLTYLYGSIGKYVDSVDRGDWIRSKTFCYFPWATRELFGKTFGVFGYGSIGKRTAKIAEAFGMNVVVCTRTPPDGCPYRIVTREEIFRISDILSLHCPLTTETALMVNEVTLSQMKPGAVLINTARGGLVDEAALAAALNSGRLYGACLDSVAIEPMRADNPLIGAKNCVITPHIAWVPRETRARVVHIAAENLKSFLNGSPVNVVN